MKIDNFKVDELLKETAKKYLLDLGYTEIINVNNSFVFTGKGDGMKTTQVYCKFFTSDKTNWWTIDKTFEDNLIDSAKSNIKLIRIEAIIHPNLNLTDFEFCYLKDL